MTNRGASGHQTADEPVRFAGISVIHNTVTHKKVTGPLAGAVAAVEPVGPAERRFTGARRLALGLLGLAFKQKDHLDLLLTVSGSGYAFVVPVGPDQRLEADRFVLDLNALADNAGVPTAQT